MDYATYLNGTAKEELDHLNKLAGRFHLDSCDLLIDGDGKPPFDVDDWEQVKDYLKENLEDDTAGGMVNFMDETEDFRIVEKEENGRRFWLVSDVDDKKNIYCRTQALGRKPIQKGFSARILLRMENLCMFQRKQRRLRVNWK